MNVNLHIDSIVLDGIELGAGQDRLLQQVVVRQLTEMITQEGIGSHSFADLDDHESNSIRLGRDTHAMALGPQLANAIYANIPQSSLRSHAADGGQP